MSIDPNPYAAPSFPSAPTEASVTAPALWNPSAAANWSLVFSPAFGAYIQMLNWRALGEPRRAAASKRWFIAILCFVGLMGFMGIMRPGTDVGSLSSNLGFIVLIVWYLVSGRSQIKFVKERFGADYVRQPWSRPLVFGLLAVLGALGVIAIAGFVVGLLTAVS